MRKKLLAAAFTKSAERDHSSPKERAARRLMDIEKLSLLRPWDDETLFHGCWKTLVWP